MDIYVIVGREPAADVRVRVRGVVVRVEVERTDVRRGRIRRITAHVQAVFIGNGFFFSSDISLYIYS